ncbi:MAG TPA: hypothetical protein VGB77_15220 [Abditibacteriaceae bacterium]
MKKWMIAATLGAAVMSSSLSSVVQAQGFGGGGGGGRGGGMNRSPKGRLSGLLRGLEELEKGKTKALTKAQAKTIVGVVNAWKAKPKMSDSEAKTVYGKLNGTLTSSQKNELDKIAAKNRRGFGGDRGGGAGGRGGGPGGGGAGGAGGGPPNPQQMAEMRARMKKMEGFFKTYNPFYPPTKYAEFKSMPDRFKDRFAKGYQARMSLVSKLAAKAK